MDHYNSQPQDVHRDKPVDTQAEWTAHLEAMKEAFAESQADAGKKEDVKKKG